MRFYSRKSIPSERYVEMFAEEHDQIYTIVQIVLLSFVDGKANGS